MEFLKKVNATDVTPEMLGEVLELYGTMAPEDRGDSAARMFRLFQWLDDKGFQKQRRLLAMAIDFRITALDQLRSDKALNGWTLPGLEPGLDFVHHDLVRAASEEPVIEDAQEHVAFDPESFRQRVLGLTRARGQA